MDGIPSRKNKLGRFFYPDLDSNSLQSLNPVIVLACRVSPGDSMLHDFSCTWFLQ
jgi:hypothetical protein